MIGRLTLGGILLGALLGTATLAGLLAPQDPLHQDLDDSELTPGLDHPLGTDPLGRDVLSRLAYGARVSLGVAAPATLLSSLLGIVMGLAAGAAGGRIDGMVMRFVDLMLAFPTLVLLLVLAALFRFEGMIALVLLLGSTTWMPLARLVRSETHALARQPFMEAAAGLGASRARCALRHLLPNILSTVLVAATLLIGDLMMMEAGLSYLGLGVAAPTPSWGDMVRQGMQDLGGTWWVAVFPGLALALSVVGFNLVGEGLRDTLDPRSTADSSHRGARWGMPPDPAAPSVS